MSLCMRALLEYLGIVEPGRTRREPVALPAWASRAGRLAPVVVAAALALVSAGAWLLIRSLAS